MTVEARIEEARLLLQLGKLEGAVGMLMVAIAGSSKKVYQRPPFSDNKAFKFFLGGRLRQILMNYNGPFPTQSLIKIEFKGKHCCLEDIIYEYCRNSILHEAAIAPEIEISANEILNPNATIVSNGTTLHLKFGKTLILDRNWIEIFFQVVVGAKCNTGAPRHKIKKLVPIIQADADDTNKFLSEEYRLTPRRITRLKEIVKILNPTTINEVNDQQLKDVFFIATKHISPRILENLKLRSIVTSEYKLTYEGLNSLRKIALTHHIVETLDESL